MMSGSSILSPAIVIDRVMLFRAPLFLFRIKPKFFQSLMFLSRNSNPRSACTPVQTLGK